MSYLDKYKVGSTLFRTLSEGRMQLNAFLNAIRFNEPAPSSIIGIQDYLARHRATNRYEKKSDAFAFKMPETLVKPASIRPLLEQEMSIEFPETFVLNVPNGCVLGDGTALVEGNAILSDTTIDFHRKQAHHRLLSERRLPKPERFEGRLAVITSPGSDNYFHWTLDSVPRMHLMAGIDDQVDAYYMDDRHPFHREWINLLNIPLDKIIPASPNCHIQASELVLPSFAGRSGLPSPEGLDFVRRFMPETTGLPRPSERIYISRSGARRRRTLNEDAFLPLLRQHGFTVLHPGEMSVHDQMAAFAAAKVVVAPHGAELTNLVYCTSGAEVIELFSPYYLNPCFKQLAALRGLGHTALIGQGGSRILRRQQDAHHVWANIRVDIKTLSDTLDALN